MNTRLLSGYEFNLVVDRAPFGFGGAGLLQIVSQLTIVWMSTAIWLIFSFRNSCYYKPQLIDWGLAMAELTADGRGVTLGVGMNVVVCNLVAGWSWCRANLRWSQKFEFLGNYNWNSKVWLMRLTTVKVAVMRWTGI